MKIHYKLDILFQLLLLICGIFSFATSFLTIIVLIRYVVYLVKRKNSIIQFTNQNVWITGASSGIGEHLAKKFNQLGAYVIISARTQTQLMRVQKQCKYPEKVEIILLDMCNYQEIQKKSVQLLNKLESKNQKLDIIVQNAGVSMLAKFQNFDFQNHLKMIDINLNGPFKHIQILSNHFIKHKSGHIVGISSVAAKLYPGLSSSYNASKAAFSALFASIRTQLNDFNIFVTSIYPGYINTNISLNSFIQQKNQKFNQIDKNLKQGMTLQQFTQQAVINFQQIYKIYNKQQEVMITQNKLHRIGCYIYSLFPDILKYLVIKHFQDTKKQLKKQ